MKIVWIADFGIQHNIGGAQRTDSLVIESGKKLGHNITMFHHDSNINILFDEKYDLVVSGNLEILSRSSSVMRFINSAKYHIRFEHDSNAYLSSSARQELFTNADKVFWLSKYHHEMFKVMYGNYLDQCNSYYVPSPIDITKFKDLGLERSNKTLYVGYFHPLKGTNEFLKYAMKNPDKEFVMAGWSSGYSVESSLVNFKNIEFIGKQRHDQMPRLFNAYRTMYYHPVKFEPFCRSVAEAIVCGMDVDVSDNIGAVHFYNEVGKEEFINAVGNSANKFWEYVNV